MINIRKMLRVLLEEKKSRYKFGCVMLELGIEQENWDSFQADIDKDDIYTGTPEDGDKFGLEKDPHITILYGIHEDVPNSDVEDIIKTFKPLKVKLVGISTFENELFDVLKFDIESEDLHEYNKQLKALPFSSDYPNYHPHCTIAYLKKGTAKKYVKKIGAEEMEITSNKIKYSCPDGTKLKFKL